MATRFLTLLPVALLGVSIATAREPPPAVPVCDVDPGFWIDPPPWPGDPGFWASPPAWAGDPGFAPGWPDPGAPAGCPDRDRVVPRPGVPRTPEATVRARPGASPSVPAAGGVAVRPPAEPMPTPRSGG